jgi:hypothetical protein
VALSVRVRWGPVVTAVNGTADEDEVGRAWQRGHQLDRKVRPVPETACIVGKGRRPAAAVRWHSNPITARRNHPLGKQS